MARKRLGDLLREEVQKSQEPGDEISSDSVLEVEAVVVTETTLEKGPWDEVQASQTAEEVSAIVSELEAKLQTAQAREQSLGDQVTTLETSLKEQKALVSQLQGEVKGIAHLQTELKQAQATIQDLQAKLEKSAHIQAELDKAQAIIVQMAETNTRLRETVEHPPAVHPVYHVEPAKLPKHAVHSHPHPASDAEPAQAEVHPVYHLEPEKLPKHAVHSHPAPPAKDGFSDFLL